MQNTYVNVKEVWVSIWWANFYFCICMEHHCGFDGFFGETISLKYLLHLLSVYGVKCVASGIKPIALILLCPTPVLCRADWDSCQTGYFPLKADSRPEGLEFRLNHIQMGELYYCHLCIALNHVDQFKL